MRVRAALAAILLCIGYWFTAVFIDIGSGSLTDKLCTLRVPASPVTDSYRLAGNMIEVSKKPPNPQMGFIGLDLLNLSIRQFDCSFQINNPTALTLLDEIAYSPHIGVTRLFGQLFANIPLDTDLVDREQRAAAIFDTKERPYSAIRRAAYGVFNRSSILSVVADEFCSQMKQAGRFNIYEGGPLLFASIPELISRCPQVFGRIPEESGEYQQTMSAWHTCQTTHCRAGWVVHLAGEAGYALERFHNTPLAAQLIYAASAPDLPKVTPPRFHETNEEALADMRRMANLEAKAAR